MLGSAGSPRPQSWRVSDLHLVPPEQVRQLERSIGLKDLAMAEMEEKIRSMEASTYDGVFVWKITEFARKRQEAITGRSPAIFSPGVQNPQNLLHLSWVWVS